MCRWPISAFSPMQPSSGHLKRSTSAASQIFVINMYMLHEPLMKIASERSIHLKECNTEKATKARHRQERQKQRHNQNHQPTKPHPNSQRTTPQTCAPNIRRTTHISQHSTSINTTVTAQQRSVPQATTAHPSPRQSAHNNTAPILQARQTLNLQPSRHSLYAAQAAQRHAEHSQKAGMVQRRTPPPPLPSYTGRATRPPEGRVRGEGGGRARRGERVGGWDEGEGGGGRVEGEHILNVCCLVKPGTKNSTQKTQNREE